MRPDRFFPVAALLDCRAVLPSFCQDDALYPLLTVRETLRFAAELRIPNMSKVTNYYSYIKIQYERKSAKFTSIVHDNFRLFTDVSL